MSAVLVEAVTKQLFAHRLRAAGAVPGRAGAWFRRRRLQGGAVAGRTARRRERLHARQALAHARARVSPPRRRTRLRHTRATHAVAGTSTLARRDNAVSFTVDMDVSQR